MVFANCDATFSRALEKASTNSSQISADSIVTDWSGFDKVNWTSITGWGALKQKPVFNAREISLLRTEIDQINKTNRSAGFDFRDLKINSHEYLEAIAQAAGEDAAFSLQKYLKEIDSNIKTRLIDFIF